MLEDLQSTHSNPVPQIAGTTPPAQQLVRRLPGRATQLEFEGWSSIGMLSYYIPGDNEVGVVRIRRRADKRADRREGHQSTWAANQMGCRGAQGSAVGGYSYPKLR